MILESRAGSRRSVWRPCALFAALAVVAAMHAAAAGSESSPTAEIASPKAYRIALLSDRIEGLDPGLVEDTAGQLRNLGFEVTLLSGLEFCDASLVNSDRFDCLLLACSPGLPIKAAATLDNFARSGGDVVLMGGDAFKVPLWRCGDEWRSTTRLVAALESSDWFGLRGFDDGNTSDWSLVSQPDDDFSTVKPDDGYRGSGLLLDCRLTEGKCMFSTAIEEGTIPEGHDVLSFYAKSSNFFTKMMCLELKEQDGATWMAPIHVGTRWQRVYLTPACFEYRGGGKDRGADGDGPRLSGVVELAVGVEKETTLIRRGAHTYWIDELAACSFKSATGVDLPDGFDVARTVAFDGAFEDYEVHRMEGIARVRTWPKQDYFMTPVDVAGPFEGVSAVGFAFHNESRFIPLLAALDGHDRVRGWAGGLVVNYAGPFTGGKWAFFGITTPSFYRDDSVQKFLGDLLTSFRDGNLTGKAQAQDGDALSHRIKLETPAPERLSVNAEGTGFVYEDGRPFFMLGCNYLGPFGRGVLYGDWNPALFEADFAKMHRFGINTVRIHGGSPLYRDPVRLEALRECARRYEIYLLLVITDHTGLFPSEELIKKRARTIARLFKDEPALLGYDLQNEPNHGALAKLEAGEKTLGELHPNNGAWWSYATWAGHDWRGDFFDFPWVRGPLQVPDDPELAKGFHDTDGIFRTWIGWYVDAIREVDPSVLLTIGHNTVYSCLPANEQLDFISQHCYKRPINHNNVVSNITTMDRLHGVWPEKPISLGEFCCSGSWTAADRPIDVQNMSVYEMIHYLYPLAKGYAGAIKWQCNDFPTAHLLRRFYGRAAAAWDPKRCYRRGWWHGMFYDDGTPGGAPKPLAYGLRFLRKYIDRGLVEGAIELRRSDNLIGTGYTFRAPNALFVGDVSFDAHGVRFRTGDDRPANLMLAWTEETLEVMSTRDITVSIRLQDFLKGKTPRQDETKDRDCGCPAGAERLEIALLAGETVTVR